MSDKLKLSEEIRRGDYEDFHLFILADKVLALEKENEGMRNEPKMGIIVENKNLKSQLQKQVDGLNREIPKNPDIMNREALIVRMKNLRNLINQSNER